MADIKIMVDSGADMPDELREQYGIGLIPLLSVFGEKSYVIGEELSNEKFYDMLVNGSVHPKTSQTPYADMYDILLKESREHDTVIYFTLSSLASGQNHSSQLVRDDIIENENTDANIIIFDTMSFSGIIAKIAIEAAKMVADGKSAEEIIEFSNVYKDKWHAFMLVSDLAYLEKGGRMRKSAAVVGSLLDIKPVLTVNNGLIEVEAKLRGKKKLCRKLCDLAQEYEGFDEKAAEFVIMHSDKDAAAELREMIEEEFDTSNGILEMEFGPLIGTNTGPGAFAIIIRTV